MPMASQEVTPNPPAPLAATLNPPQQRFSLLKSPHHLLGQQQQERHLGPTVLAASSLWCWCRVGCLGRQSRAAPRWSAPCPRQTPTRGSRAYARLRTQRSAGPPCCADTRRRWELSRRWVEGLPRLRRGDRTDFRPRPRRLRALAIAPVPRLPRPRRAPHRPPPEPRRRQESCGRGRPWRLCLSVTWARSSGCSPRWCNGSRRRWWPPQPDATRRRRAPTTPQCALGRSWPPTVHITADWGCIDSGRT